MGGLFSRQSGTKYIVSYAPTDRAKCSRCKKPIQKGSLRLSRDIPTESTGDYGKMTIHYHFDHGITAVKAMRCRNKAGDLTPPPVMVGDADLRAPDAKKARKQFETAAAVWSQLCK